MNRQAALVGVLLLAISPLFAQTGGLRIRVTDPTGAVVPTAAVSLLGPDDHPIRTMEATETGEIVFTDLPLGASRFSVHSPGFRICRVGATIRDTDEQKVEARLEVASH